MPATRRSIRGTARRDGPVYVTDDYEDSQSPVYVPDDYEDLASSYKHRSLRSPRPKKVRSSRIVEYEEEAEPWTSDEKSALGNLIDIVPWGNFYFVSASIS